MLIYKVVNTKNGHIYIGQTTKTSEERRARHERDAVRLNRKSVKFHNALVKYGTECFEWSVLRECETQDELDYWEVYYIKEFNCLDRETGYNLKSGGNARSVYTDEARANIGATTKAKWENPECAAKMKAGLNKATEVWKQKAANNFEERICPICGKTFKVKPFERKRFCSSNCANINAKNDNPGFEKATEINKAKYNEEKNKRLELVKEWMINNSDKLTNIKMNDLKFLNDICKYIGVKDARSLAKVLDVTNKRDTVKQLLKTYAELSDNQIGIPDQMEGDQ